MTDDVSEVQLHERLRQLLMSARSESCQVVATFLDIRGFSAFSTRGESFDVAYYLRSAFSAILSLYFADATYFKTTGDGLMVIHELSDDRETVPGTVSSILKRSVELVRVFPDITEGDFMVPPPVPEDLGIGIARGPATRLVSGDLIVDYTGRCLNLAARLMDKARPRGVVFNDSHPDLMMTAEVAELFSPDKVCIRGISEEKALPIRISTGVKIWPSDREPPSRTSERWGSPIDLTVKEVRQTPLYGFYLPRPPNASEVPTVYVECPLLNAKNEVTGAITTTQIQGTTEETPRGTVGEHRLRSRSSVDHKRLPRVRRVGERAGPTRPAREW